MGLGSRKRKDGTFLIKLTVRRWWPDPLRRTSRYSRRFVSKSPRLAQRWPLYHLAVTGGRTGVYSNDSRRRSYRRRSVKCCSARWWRKGLAFGRGKSNGESTRRIRTGSARFRRTTANYLCSHSARGSDESTLLGRNSGQ